jgi:HKD family nuclease
MLYTNLGADKNLFRLALDEKFNSADQMTIASGYASLDILEAYRDKFIAVAEAGGKSRLLLGMAFHEGLNQKKLDFVKALNTELSTLDIENGVFVTYQRRYHGKVYHFVNKDEESVYVGSSNFSSSGTKGNIECTIAVSDDLHKRAILNFMDDLFSTDNAIKIDKAAITVPGKKKPLTKKVENNWDSLERFDPNTIDITKLPRFDIPFSNMENKERSNINAYFGKGRLNRKSGIVTPRAWYEVEIIAGNEINSLELYPKGEFLAYTDDGYIIPMKTQGDYAKNVRSLNSLQIFGRWMKGKLENSGALKKYQPVTYDTLSEFGNDKLSFYKISEGKYFIKF